MVIEESYKRYLSVFFGYDLPKAGYTPPIEIRAPVVVGVRNTLISQTPYAMSVLKPLIDEGFPGLELLTRKQFVDTIMYTRSKINARAIRGFEKTTC